MDPQTECIFYRDKNNKILTCGYEINSIFKDLKMPPITSSGLPTLTVPAGLFHMHRTIQENFIEDEKIDNISDDLYEKLLKEFLYSSQKKKSRKKKRKNKKNKSRKRT